MLDASATLRILAHLQPYNCQPAELTVTPAVLLPERQVDAPPSSCTKSCCAASVSAGPTEHASRPYRARFPPHTLAGVGVTCIGA